MSPQEFCYWLKGFFELMDAGPKRAEKLVLTAKQVDMIEKHLKSVFQEKIMISPRTPEQETGPSLPQPPYTVTCSQKIPSQAIC